MSSKISGYERLVTDFGSRPFCAGDLESLLPRGVVPLGRVDFVALQSRLPFPPDGIASGNLKTPQPLQEDLLRALNHCSAYYKRLRREHEGPNTKEMVAHWKQMRDAAQALASLALGGSSSDHPDKVDAAWMKREPKFKNEMARLLEAGFVESDLDCTKNAAEIEVDYAAWLQDQSIPRGLFRGDIHHQFKVELAEAYASVMSGNAPMQSEEWTARWHEGGQAVPAFFMQLAAMLSVLEKAIENAEDRVVRNPPRASRTEDFARNWLLATLMRIWRDILGQPTIDQRGVTGRDGRFGRGVPAECITFVTRAAE